MKNKTFLKFTSFLLGSLISYSAIACGDKSCEDNNKNNNKRFSLDYEAVITGPSLAYPTSKTHFDNDGDDHQGPVNFENNLEFSYYLTENVALSVVGRWDIALAHGKALHLADPYARLRHEKLINFDHFNFEADLRVSAPISDTSQDEELFTSIASQQVSTYELESIHSTLGLETFAQVNLHDHAEDHGEDGFELYFKPFFDYHVTETLDLNVAYELTKNSKVFSDLKLRDEEGSLVELGLSWHPLESLMLNPNLHTRTSRPFNGKNITVGLNVEWNIL